MERGTEWEHEAVRRRWATLERQRRLATRLVVGVTSLFLGVTILLVTIPSEACIGDGGVPPRCFAVGTATADVWLVLPGGIALAAGIWLSWAALRS